MRSADVSSLEFEAILGSFELEKMSSTGFVTAPTNPPTPAPPTTTILVANETTTENVIQIEVTTEGPGFFDNIAAGLRGENDTYLGIFIGVVGFVVLCIVGCIIVAVQVAKKKRADKKLFDAYGEGKPMQSFETVTAKPSAALGDEDSDDDQPFGILSTPTAPSSVPGTMGGYGTTDDAPRVGIKVEPLTDSDESD